MKIVSYHGKPAFYKGILISNSIYMVGFPETNLINIFQHFSGPCGLLLLDV